MDEFEETDYGLEETRDKRGGQLFEIVVFGTTIEVITTMLKTHPIWAAHLIIAELGNIAELAVNEWFPDVPEKQKMFAALKHAHQQRRIWRKRAAR